MIASRNNGTFMQSCLFFFLNIKFCMNENENINGQSPFLDILDNKTLYKKDAQSWGWTHGQTRQESQPLRLIKASKQPEHVKGRRCTCGIGGAWRLARSVAAPSPEAADPATGSGCLKVGRTTGKTASQTPAGRSSPRPSHLWTLSVSPDLRVLHWLQPENKWCFFFLTLKWEHLKEIHL